MPRAPLDRPARPEVTHLGFQALDLKPDHAPSREGEQNLSAWRILGVERDREELQRKLWVVLVEADAAYLADMGEMKARLAPCRPAGRDALPVDPAHYEREMARCREEGHVAEFQIGILQMGRHDAQVFLVEDGKVQGAAVPGIWL